jgi:hypothetical protein
VCSCTDVVAAQEAVTKFSSWICRKCFRRNVGNVRRVGHGLQEFRRTTAQFLLQISA